MENFDENNRIYENNKDNENNENVNVETYESYEEDDEEILIASDYIKEKIEEVVDKYMKINPSLQETLNLLKNDLIREIELIEESYDEFEDDEFSDEDEDSEEV